MNTLCFSNVSAVVFDKDGTLIDFDAFWVSVSERATELILSQLGIVESSNEIVSEVLFAYGIRSGVTDIDGVLCKGTYRQMSDIFADILLRYGYAVDKDEFHKMLLKAYEEATSVGVIAPTSVRLKESLLLLREQGIRLFVVTTDNLEITEKCLAGLGILELFDKIYCDDGIMPTKPNPAAIDDLTKSFGIDKSEIVMVGDTMTDIRFAKNAGVRAIGLARCEANAEKLRPHADMVLCNAAELVSVIGEG